VTPRHLLKPARLAGSPLLSTQSDERLVDLVRAGSEAAFDAIVARYRGQLLRYCGAIVGRERAEDVVQQTFVNAFTAMNKDESELNLKPWLYRIAHNGSLNALRDRGLREEQLDTERDTQVLGQAVPAQPQQELERRDEIAAVFAAVEDLPPRQRDAIVLRELEGRSYDEIAAALGVGGGSVRALLHRARNSVRAAATAITPVGLLLRIPPAGTEAGESVAARVAELTAGVGAGAAGSKVAATVLVTGAVAGGVALGPGQGDGRQAGGQDAPNPPSARATPPEAIAGDDSGSSGSGSGGELEDEREDEREDRSGPSDRSGPGDGDDRDRDEDNSGPGGGGDNSGPGSESSGPGGGGSSGPGGGDHGGDNSGPGSGGSGSGGSGSGESSGPGSGGSGSGSSGSGSGSSGSGSGSSGSGSGSSGSGSSGSGSSGSGDDPLDTH
jgi:RNA polymerase sigma factor (sigma-70 family)